MSNHLAVIPNENHSIADRAKRLNAEARALAAEHINEFLSQYQAAENVAAQILEFGDNYPVGVVELLRRHLVNSNALRQNIKVIMARSTK